MPAAEAIEHLIGLTSPVVFALGIGFAVPFMLVTAPIRAALVIADWPRLTQTAGSQHVDDG